MRFFFMLKTKEDILKNVGNQTVDFQSRNFFNFIFFCVQQKKETWNNMRASMTHFIRGWIITLIIICCTWPYLDTFSVLRF